MSGGGASGPADDLSARTGSSPSLVLTVVGLYLRRVGGWMATSSLVHLAQEAGSPPARTRSAITRLKRRGVLVSQPRAGSAGHVAGYVLDAAAEEMFRRGDRRIFGPRMMGSDEPWCLISYTIGEEQRPLRHQLRRRLRWIGCGAVAQGLWICPDHLRGEVEGILEDLDARGLATLFRVDQLDTPGPVADAAGQWWDLEGLGARHRRFQHTVEGLLPPGAGSGPESAGPECQGDGCEGAEREGAEAFRRYLRGMDAWRDIPYVDPGLPSELLPHDWPGARSVELFHSLQTELADLAFEYVQGVTAR